MAGRGAPEPVVLLVEDDPGDVMMIREAFEESKQQGELCAVGDGEQALSFLRRAGGSTTAPRPGLILLDLSLPGRDGLAVLAEVKTDADLLTIPVVVLTSSRSPGDVQRCYALHANAYVTKPKDFDGMSEVIRQITACFLDLIELPD
jgi:CheY-like chemotaxis protein